MDVSHSEDNRELITHCHREGDMGNGRIFNSLTRRRTSSHNQIHFRPCATDLAGTRKTTIEMTSSLSPGDATSSPNLHHVTTENGMLATRAMFLCNYGPVTESCAKISHQEISMLRKRNNTRQPEETYQRCNTTTKQTKGPTACPGVSPGNSQI